jgi:hypothetical protein
MKRVLAVVAAVAAILGLTTGIVIGDTLTQDGTASQASGGGMITNNGQLEWGVPAGAASFNLGLRYIEDNITSFVPPNGVWVGNPFTLRVWDLDTGVLVTTNQPMTLHVHYGSDQLAGRDPSTLHLVRLVNVQWVDLPATVDPVNQVVTVQINASGDFGLLSENAPAASAPAPAPAALAPAAPAPAPAPVAPTSSAISGQVFFDKDGNGVMDDGDFPVGGAGVFIASGNWSAFARTGPDGRYSFQGLGNGSYTVYLIVGPEWAFTTPFTVPGISVTGQQGSNGSANFGLWYRVTQ